MRAVSSTAPIYARTSAERRMRNGPPVGRASATSASATGGGCARARFEPLLLGELARWRPFSWQTEQGLADDVLTHDPAPVVVLDLEYSGNWVPRLSGGRSRRRRTTAPAGTRSRPGYFDVFRIPILRGRDFTDRESAGAGGVVIINQAMARQFWPQGDPLSDQLVIGKGVGPAFVEGPRQISGSSATCGTARSTRIRSRRCTCRSRRCQTA